MSEDEWSNMLNFYQYGLGGLIELGAFKKGTNDDEKVYELRS